MSWIFLLVAGLFEIASTTFLKLSNNFTHPKYLAGFVLSMIVSFYLLTRAMQHIPLGTCYAIWTGIGAAGTVLMGVFFFRDPVEWKTLFFCALIITSVVGLKLTQSSSPKNKLSHEQHIGR